ncbi:hypothetical protein ACFY9Q_19465 [Streptomyces sp. NPDC012389]|uniref:hypothetical protein n=1 Tax=Streptomyces sp. NPDC012389 TaxID=3364830 RepID=UPI0036E6E2EE
MPNTAYIYVPTLASEQLDTGLSNGRWGWRASALERGGALQDAQTLEPGDYLVFGHRGPNSRVKPGGWSDATLQRVVVAQLTTALFTEETPIWHDDTYPERIGLRVIADLGELSGPDLGSRAMESLRLSANKRGVPVVTPGAEVMGHLVVGISAEPADSADWSAAADWAASADRAEPDDGALSQVLQGALSRRNTSVLRKRMLGASTGTCAFCGRTLPNSLLSVIHITPLHSLPAEAGADVDNCTVACNLGCEQLFRRGYVTVDAEGIVTAGPRSRETPDVHQAAGAISGRLVAGFTARSAPFFARHRDLNAI